MCGVGVCRGGEGGGCMVEMCHLGLGKESNSCMRVCVLSNAIATHSTTFIPLLWYYMPMHKQ